jgi:hypothetical protein
MAVFRILMFVSVMVIGPLLQIFISCTSLGKKYFLLTWDIYLHTPILTVSQHIDYPYNSAMAMMKCVFYLCDTFVATGVCKT